MSFLSRLFGGDKAEEKSTSYLLVECMYDAVRADGVVHEAELEVLEKTAREHEYFQNVPAEEFNQLVKRAAGETRKTKTRRERAEQLAEKLPGRAYRLAAYALACDVCVADGHVDDEERGYLKELARAFMLTTAVADSILKGATSSTGLASAETAHKETLTRAPAYLACMALMASADGHLDDSEVDTIRRIARRLPDVRDIDDLDGAIDRATTQASYKNPEQEILVLARGDLASKNDRYWALVYMAAVASSDGGTDWREAKLLETARDSFGLEANRYEEALRTGANLARG